MRENRLRDKMLHVWLHEKELNFIKKYSTESLMTYSELIRSLLHQLMRQEGVELKEPLLPTQNRRKT